jgi:diketogulonate reductase-like aldo/keto reductase
VTTSANKQRQKEQLEFNSPAWKLSDEQMNEIDQAGERAPFRKFWGHQKNAQWDP